MKTPEDFVGEWLAEYEAEHNTEALKRAWALYTSPDTDEELKAQLVTAIDYMINRLEG